MTDTSNVPPCLAKQYAGRQEKDIPRGDIVARYGNQTGRYLKMRDQSTLWVDPDDGECLWFIGSM